MKKILALAALLFLLPFTANAQNMAYQFPDDYSIERIVGDQMVISGASTFATFDFGMQSRYVRFCIDADAGESEVFLRFGHTLTASRGAAIFDTTGMTVTATSEDTFRDGTTNPATGDIQGSAISIAGSFEATKSNVNVNTFCSVEPWVTRGLIMVTRTHLTGNVGNATADVWVYPKN